MILFFIAIKRAQSMSERCSDRSDIDCALAIRVSWGLWFSPSGRRTIRVYAQAEDLAFEIVTGSWVIAKRSLHWTVGHAEAARPGLRRGDRAPAIDISPPMEKLVGWRKGGACYQEGWCDRGLEKCIPAERTTRRVTDIT